MAKSHTIRANGTSFQARPGDLILDSALRNGIEYPHDCRAGRCGSCLTKVVRGVTYGGESLQSGMVHACLARVLTDIELRFDELPPVGLVRGHVNSLVKRSYDVMEVGITLSRPLDFYPGQYCRFKFRGFPERSFSPTWPVNLEEPAGDLTLHVKRVRGGLVSNALGEAIQVGHRVTVEGPFGAAFYRSASGRRLVLVAGGTGFAPILSIAMAALADDPMREIELIAGARKTDQLYMAVGLVNLRRYPNLRFTMVAQEVPEHLTVVRQGGPADFLPDLLDTDVVYAAGAPAMIKQVAAAAALAGAEFYSDPFTANPVETQGWLSGVISGVLKRPSAAAEAQDSQHRPRAEVRAYSDAA